jgi:hypothetical protein
MDEGEHGIELKVDVDGKDNVGDEENDDGGEENAQSGYGL